MVSGGCIISGTAIRNSLLFTEVHTNSYASLDHVASECAPLIKTGGLADVVGALPATLAVDGVEMRILLPGYTVVTEALEGCR